MLITTTTVVYPLSTVNYSLAAYLEPSRYIYILAKAFKLIFQILRDHRKNPEVGKHFETIESMTSYEVETDLVKTKAKEYSTGSRNLLRLHRALEYIIGFLDSIQVQA